MMASKSHTITNKVDGFKAEIVHSGKMQYEVHLSSGDVVDGFLQLGEANLWASRVVGLGLADWLDRKAFSK